MVKTPLYFTDIHTKFNCYVSSNDKNPAIFYRYTYKKIQIYIRRKHTVDITMCDMTAYIKSLVFHFLNINIKKTYKKSFFKIIKIRC